MKTKQWWFLVVLVVIVAIGAINIFANSRQKNKSSINANENGVAVVELFTSEGCSSCPPADALLAKLQDEGKPNVFLLAFHVDYWNYLGWKDRFSDAAYSQRQQKYSKLLNSDVYTPQMVVNGSTQFVGSNETAAANTIKELLAEAAPLSINITPQYNSEGRSVSVSYRVQGDFTNELLNVALVQKTAESNVHKGENSGRHLSHVDVVRGFQTLTLTQSTGIVKLNLPADVSIADIKVVAYSQLSTDLKVSGATSAAVNSN